VAYIKYVARQTNPPFSHLIQFFTNNKHKYSYLIKSGAKLLIISHLLQVIALKIIILTIKG
ncbi:hypothetical protein, partial [Segatella hominis]|uniref:hypothetical protein n=1 Tax=Segatella hominis TaxID=2518605 RepID=UPI003AAEF2C6